MAGSPNIEALGTEAESPGPIKSHVMPPKPPNGPERERGKQEGTKEKHRGRRGEKRGEEKEGKDREIILL